MVKIKFELSFVLTILFQVSVGALPLKAIVSKVPFIVKLIWDVILPDSIFDSVSQISLKIGSVGV